MNALTHFDIARRFLKAHEGLCLTEYKDTTGNKTIGYGWNLDAKPLPQGVGKKDAEGKWVISEPEAEGLLDTSMIDHWNELTVAFPWVQSLNPWRKAVLLDMAFNMGIPMLKTFKNTLNAVLLQDYTDAARRMLQSKWAGQVKRRADVLAEVMRLGAMPASLMKTYNIDLSGE
jgi:lysozyme